MNWLSIIFLVALLVLAYGFIWLFSCHGIDRIRHPEEWKTAGSSGEQILYNTLIQKIHVPKNQILRNVYIPTKSGKTSEIDLLVISKKGIFVFECKNYGGNIYGDTNRPRWIQYMGSRKNYFYNPLLQNKNHVKYLKEFFMQDNIEVPIIPLVSTISRGKWKIKNLKDDDYILGVNCHFKDIYNTLPSSDTMAINFKKIMDKLLPLSRPSEDIRDKHIKQIQGQK